MRLAAIALCAFLTACNGVQKLPTVVKVPVSVPCITETIEAPIFVSDADLKKMADYDFVLTLAKDRLERRQYIGTLEATIAGCR